MHRALIHSFITLTSLLILLISSAAAQTRSPENQVFQFMQRGTLEYAAGDVVKTTAYLWIPEKCERLVE